MHKQFFWVTIGSAIALLAILIAAFFVIPGPVQAPSSVEEVIQQEDEDCASEKTSQECASKGVGNTLMFYQIVGIYDDAVLEDLNGIRSGITNDGILIHTPSDYWVAWNPFGAREDDPESTLPQMEDPVFSQTSDGRFHLTASAGRTTTEQGNITTGSAQCPLIKEVQTLSADECDETTQPLAIGKRSTIFETNGNRHIIFQGHKQEIKIANLGPADGSALPTSICSTQTRVDTIDELKPGQFSSIELANAGTNLVFSDMAIAQRTNNEWVLFAKGIRQEQIQATKTGDLIEECERGIYRLTSNDLLTWTAPEQVLTSVSLPETYTDASGRVWLYWMDFSQACENGSKNFNRAPIMTAWENNDFTLADPVQVRFADELFESEEQLHYATNANPINLTEQQLGQYQGCLQ